MSFGSRCLRTKTVMTKYGRQKRCAQFAGGDDGMGDDFGDDFGDFGGSPSIAGPLIGGGTAQVVTIATKMLGRGKKIEKWAGVIGLGVSGALSGVLAFRQSSRSTGISALITAGLVTLPRIVEDLLAPKTGLKGFGVHTAERELAGVTTEEMQGAEEMLGADIQLLDSGGGGGVMGVYTAESEMRGDDMDGANEAQLYGAQQDVSLLGAQSPNAPVDLLGGAGFGSNFLSAQ